MEDRCSVDGGDVALGRGRRQPGKAEVLRSPKAGAGTGLRSTSRVVGPRCRCSQEGPAPARRAGRRGVRKPLDVDGLAQPARSRAAGRQTSRRGRPSLRRPRRGDDVLQMAGSVERAGAWAMNTWTVGISRRQASEHDGGLRQLLRSSFPGARASAVHDTQPAARLPPPPFARLEREDRHSWDEALQLARRRSAGRSRSAAAASFGGEARAPPPAMFRAPGPCGQLRALA